MDGVEGAQVGRDGGELQLHRGFQQLPQPFHVHPRSSVFNWSAVRRASAARVRVGFDVPIVGKLPEPIRYRLECSQLRWSAFTTELAGSSPIRCVPAKWPIPWYRNSSP